MWDRLGRALSYKRHPCQDDRDWSRHALAFFDMVDPCQSPFASNERVIRRFERLPGEGRGPAAMADMGVNESMPAFVARLGPGLRRGGEWAGVRRPPSRRLHSMRRSGVHPANGNGR